jgi:hypothetical protein
MSDHDSQEFVVHWSHILENGTAETALFALWPSPVNPDACFREAGFSRFGDGDENWDANASGLLSRLLGKLERFGAPNLKSQPIKKQEPLFRQLFKRPTPISPREQIEIRTVYDEFPDCVIGFGSSGFELRTGNGHHIFWIAVPNSESARFIASLNEIAGSHQLVRTDLKWNWLLDQPKH